MTPDDYLRQGIAILDPVMKPAGFEFVLGACGIGSGGPFASGTYERGGRKLELHFRTSLGLVTYHIGGDHIGHRDLMRALGRLEDAAYPGFSDDPLAGFRDLRQDLERFGGAFLEGQDLSLKRAAREATERDAEHWKRTRAGYEGDGGRRERARTLFRQGDYAGAAAAFAEVKHPDLLTESERRMWHLAQDRT